MPSLVQESRAFDTWTQRAFLLLLCSCNLPWGSCCQPPFTTGTRLNGLCFTYPSWLSVLPVAFLHKSPRLHAKIHAHSFTLHPESSRIEPLGTGTWAVHPDADHLPGQNLDKGQSACVLSSPVCQKSRCTQWRPILQPLTEGSSLRPGEENEFQEAAAYGLVFWISPTNLYSKPAISMVAMETKVLEYNETHVRVPLPPLSAHHSAFHDSEGKEKSVCNYSLVVATEV